MNIINCRNNDIFLFPKDKPFPLRNLILQRLSKLFSLQDL